jgi:hypothetical protein
MNTMQRIKNAKFISGWEGKQFIWGKTDCMQFLFSWYDYLTASNYQAAIEDEYKSKREAAKFWKRYKLSAKQWMVLRGFEQLSSTEHAREGDIALIYTRLYPSIYINHNMYWWTSMEGGSVQSADFTDSDYNTPPNSTIWRLR